MAGSKSGAVPSRSGLDLSGILACWLCISSPIASIWNSIYELISPKMDPYANEDEAMAASVLVELAEMDPD